MLDGIRFREDGGKGGSWSPDGRDAGGGRSDWWSGLRLARADIKSSAAESGGGSEEKDRAVHGDGKWRKIESRLQEETPYRVDRLDDSS